LLFDFLVTVVGLALLLAGGDLMVRGASALARRLGVSPLAVGITVVAFGTSAPELAVNVTAAWRGSGAISFGNIFGSNMANIGLIVAAAALVRPIQIKSLVIAREVPMMLLATAVAAVLALDGPLSSRENLFDRGDGITLVLLFSVFIYYTVNDVLRQRQDHLLREGRAMMRDDGVNPVGEMGAGTSLAFVLVGVAGLVFGAELTVDGSVGLARGFGVPEAIIGLTLVAIGTSLPELAASLVATFRGESDIAIGNVVGSNIFNLLLVLGVSAAIRPIEVPVGGLLDVAVVAVLSVALWLTSSSQGNVIIRAEAALLFALYLSYMGWRAATA
jgi:cation:H+ antiporter